jgi:hypothetical protein
VRRNACKSAGGQRGVLSYGEFTAALRLCGMAQFSEALLDSGLTIRKAVTGALRLKPRMAGLERDASAASSPSSSPRASAAAAEHAPPSLSLWATPLEALASSADDAPPLPLPRASASSDARPGSPDAPNTPTRGGNATGWPLAAASGARAADDADTVVSPAQRVLAAAAAAEREAAAAEAAARRQRAAGGSESSDDDDYSAAASASWRPRLNVEIKPRASAPSSTAPPPRLVPLAPPPGGRRASAPAAAPLVFVPRAEGAKDVAPAAAVRAPKAPPPPPPLVAWVHEEHRAIWAGEKVRAMHALQQPAHATDDAFRFSSACPSATAAGGWPARPRARAATWRGRGVRRGGGVCVRCCHGNRAHRSAARA